MCTRVQCRTDKSLTFATSSSPPRTFSPPLLPFSCVLVREPVGLIWFSQLGLGLEILGVSLPLCSPYTKMGTNGDGDDLARFTQTHQQIQRARGEHKGGQTRTRAHTSQFSQRRVKQKRRRDIEEKLLLAFPPSCCH